MLKLLEEIRTENQRKIAAMVFCYSLANSLIGVFLPAYYLKIGQIGLGWVIEFLASQFIVLGIVPKVNLRFFPNQFERLIYAGFALYISYDLLLIYSNSSILIGVVAGLALGTFWPSFNTLQLRLTDKQNRTATINTISILVMTVAASIGPLLGGLLISTEGGNYTSALVLSSAFYLLSIVSMRKFGFAKSKVIVPALIDAASTPMRTQVYKSRLFFLGFVVQGLSEVSWFVYPIYVLALTGNYFALGVVASAASVAVAAFSVTLGRLSDSMKSRFGLIAIGIVLNSLWYATLPSVHNEIELILASLIIGVAGALTSNIFSLLGDEFPKQEYASMFVRIETALMFGRLGNLAIMAYFMVDRNYTGYFGTSAFIVSLGIPIFYLLHKSVRSREELEGDLKSSVNVRSL